MCSFIPPLSLHPLRALTGGVSAFGHASEKKKNHYPPLRATVHRKQPVLSERPIRNTHVQPPHPICAGGMGLETERVGWGTKEIVRKERKRVGESITLELRLRRKTEETCKKNRSTFYLLLLSIDTKFTLRSRTPHCHVPLDILAHVNTYSLWTPLKL